MTTTIRRALICTAAATLAAVPALAQNQPSPPTKGTVPEWSGSPPILLPDPPRFSMGMSEGLEALPLPSVDVIRILGTESCNTWTEAAVYSPTVSVTRLAVPGKAGGEYQKACAAFKEKRLADAESHSRQAVTLYENYAAAWVLLGQVLDAEHKPDEAREACARASKADPDYSPPYICRAEFAMRDGDWEAVSKWGRRALELDPANNAYAYYYSAVAALHFKRYSEAELNGKSAAKLDVRNRLPQLHLLLAKVYEAKGDPKAEAAELRKYVKLVPNAPDAAAAKDALARLEARRAN